MGGIGATGSQIGNRTDFHSINKCSLYVLYLLCRLAEEAVP